MYILAVMHLQTRRVHIAAITSSPNATWITQVCRNLTDCEDGGRLMWANWTRIWLKNTISVKISPDVRGVLTIGLLPGVSRRCPC